MAGLSLLKNYIRRGVSAGVGRTGQDREWVLTSITSHDYDCWIEFTC